MSIIRTALASALDRVVLFYANRDETSVIFAVGRSPSWPPSIPTGCRWCTGSSRCRACRREDQLREFAAAYSTRTSFCCGPAPFMKAVSDALRALEFPRDRRHQEKFVSLGGNPFGDVEEVLAAQATLVVRRRRRRGRGRGPGGPSGPVKVEVELDGEDHVFDDWQPGQKLLEFLESRASRRRTPVARGSAPPAPSGCIAGEVRMLHNDVLEQEDLDEGIRLGCQSVPATEDPVKISYS